jgi:hypothetical protein
MSSADTAVLLGIERLHNSGPPRGSRGQEAMDFAFFGALQQFGG